MFKKVLIAEDMDSINEAVATVLKDLGVAEVGIFPVLRPGLAEGKKGHSG